MSTKLRATSTVDPSVSDDWAGREPESTTPPRNFRRLAFRRVCANCRFFRMEDGTSLCTRTDGPMFENDGWEWFWHTCDNWTDPGED